MEQLLYHRKLEHLITSSTFSELGSIRMRLAWMVDTRLDVAIDISQLAQITVDTYQDDSVSAVSRLNAVITYTNNNLLQIKCLKIDLDSLRLIGYSDAAFINNTDQTSQLRQSRIACRQ